MDVNRSKWSENMPTSFIARPSKIYPNWIFWFESMPSGNPALDAFKVFKPLAGLHVFSAKQKI
jgi:hypothetical protein